MKMLTRSKAKELKGLSSKKERDNTGLFLAEGEKCVRDLIGGFELEYLIATPSWIISNGKFITSYEDKILESDKRGLEIISTLNSVPDIIAVFRKRFEDGKGLKLEKGRLYLLLDDIQDPGNLGTIIRTCDWFGVYDIFASQSTADAYAPKVVKSTMGSLSRVNIHYVDLKVLVTNNPGFKVIGTLLEGEPIEDFHKLEEGLIIMGNEGNGISSELLPLIDTPVTIPPVNKKAHPDSLNVAIATAIVLSKFRGN